MLKYVYIYICLNIYIWRWVNFFPVAWIYGW